jgi:ABC-type spermidine/putrescine transport system permease subunit II
MTAMSFDPGAIYFIIAMIGLPLLAMIYMSLTETWYWKGFKDGKRLAENNQRQRVTR